MRSNNWVVLLAVLFATGCFGRGDGDDPDGGGDGGIADGGGGDGGVVDGGDGPCIEGERRCADTQTAQVCEANDVWTDVPCATGTGCQSGLCLQQICTPTEARCADSATLETCNAGGTAWELTPCPTPGACDGDQCVAFVCTPGIRRCVSSSIEELCAADGSGWIASNCAAAEQCFAAGCVVPVCTPNETRCIDTLDVEVCRADATGWDTLTCPQPGECVADRCVLWACSPGDRRCTSTTAYEACASDGSGWIALNCPGNEVCLADGLCEAPICTPGTTRCPDANNLETCRSDGSAWDSAPCGANMVCSGNTCQASVCTPFERRCVNTTNAEACAADGTGWVADPCGAGNVCIGAGTCTPQVCTPGGAGCFDTTTLGTCNATGTGWTAGASCPGTETCSGGSCTSDPCAAAANDGAAVGCGFWAAPTPGVSPGEAGEQMFLIANPGTTTAAVTLTDASGNAQTASVTARSDRVVYVDTSDTSYSTGIYTDGWRITSSIPVALYQATPKTRSTPMQCDALCFLAGGICDASFNCSSGGVPLMEAAGSGAWSRVIPEHGLGTRYTVPALPHQVMTDTGASPGVRDYPWAITIVATRPGSTTVTVDLAGDSEGGGGISQAAGGGTVTFSLNQQQTARIVTRGTDQFPFCSSIGTDLTVCEHPSGDLSGTRVTATQDVAVLTGSLCHFAPRGDEGCDQMEAFVPPWVALGQVHIVGTQAGVDQRFHVTATKNGTTVSFNPTSVSGGVTLDVGETHAFITDVPFVVSTTAPAIVTRVTLGRDYPGATLDPSLEVLGGVAQLRTDGVFSVPVSTEPYTMVVFGAQSLTPLLDGSPVTLTAIGNSGFGVSEFQVSAGFHGIAASGPIGVSLWGGEISSGFLNPSSFGHATSSVWGYKVLRTGTPDAP